ncbi:MAG: peptidoglycan-binding domain-containing protein [Bacillota bacterium]
MRRLGPVFAVFPAVILFLTIFAAEAPAAGLTYGSRGFSVRRLQQDLAYLGYLSGLPTGYYGAKTKSAVKSFQRDNGLEIDGIAGPRTLEFVARRVRERSASLSSRRNDAMGLVPWSEVNLIFPRGATAKVWDTETKKCFTVWRLQGAFHADVEPLTKEDTAIMLDILGGRWNSARRAVLVEIGGRLIAGSIYPYPHGNEAIHNNNFNGQFCLHFLGSRVHKSGRVDPTHQAAVMRAAEAYRTWNIVQAEAAAPADAENAIPAENNPAVGDAGMEVSTSGTQPEVS